MDGRKSFLLSIVALALAGCQTTGGDVAPQNFGGFSASSCQSGSNKCVVTISVAAGKSCTDSANITISPDVLEMKGRKGPIVWVFADKDYEFCPTKGDGVYIQSMGTATSQFVNWGGTDKENGDEETQTKDKCFKRFRMYNYNSDSAETDYYYFIRFTDPLKKSCSKDPWVRNG